MQTYYKIWMHFIWATSKWQRIITNELKQKLILHYKKYGKEKGFYVDTVNGDMEHVHLLVSIKPSQTPSGIANALKGESSNWINRNKYIRSKFAWQRGYSVFSVSESQVGKVKNYIKNQEKHHRKKTYQEEVVEFLKLYGIKE